MNSALFLALRRMRAPLLLLIASYAIAILGLVIIPGRDSQGLPWQMGFFHAFYFVSYTATTIGFGEVPHPFTDAQRLWVTFSIYLTVVAWFYALGKIIALTQEPSFRQVLARARLQRKVRRLHEPFYIICGYGETGSALVAALDRRGLRCVVLDLNPERVAEADMAGLSADTPALVADVRAGEALIVAGLHSPHCVGVVALTSDDRANLAVAVGTKLLRPELEVLCRCESRDVAANMASFGTDHIINPYESFARHLGMAMRASGLYLLREWLTATPDELLPEPRFPPLGHWVLCGFGRFGREIAHCLGREGIRCTVIDLDPAAVHGVDGSILGSGTAAAVLEKAGIRQAAGLVAGTSSDVDNLAVVMTARELNPGLFVVVRRNQRSNAVLTDAVGAQLVMQPAAVVVHEAMALLTEPLLARFLDEVGRRDNAWANEVIARLVGVLGEHAPETWSFTVDPHAAPALHAAARGGRVCVGALGRDPRDRAESLPVVALAIERGGALLPLPLDSDPLCPGDRVLFCGRGRGRRKQQFLVHDANALRYVLTGEDAPGGWIWQRLANRRRAGPAGA